MPATPTAVDALNVVIADLLEQEATHARTADEATLRGFITQRIRMGIERQRNALRREAEGA